MRSASGRGSEGRLAGLDRLAGLSGLAAHLDERGALDNPAWRALFSTTPRHLFIPDTAWAQDSRGRLSAIDLGTDPGRWWRAVYGPDVIVTQLNDGRGVGGANVATSSCPMPEVVLAMLTALDVAGGQRVLEIGTGTGYNAALLSARLGARNVTSIEVDGQVAAGARARLERAGHQPTLVVGDGSSGHPAGAPYDRLIATCAVHRVPYAWVEQTKPGGVIVLPWATAMGSGPAALLRLTVGEDGTASGRFGRCLSFMWLREQRACGPPLDAEATGEPQASRTALDPHDVTFVDGNTVFVIGAQVPDCRNGLRAREDGWTFWLCETGPGARSWARVHHREGAGTYRVEQYGPRRLWNEVEQAYRCWVDLERPSQTRFGLTVTPEGQRVWLDTPDGPSWPAPTVSG